MSIAEWIGGKEPEPNVSGSSASIAQAILIIAALAGYLTVLAIEALTKRGRKEMIVQTVKEQREFERASAASYAIDVRDEVTNQPLLVNDGDAAKLGSWGSLLLSDSTTDPPFQSSTHCPLTLPVSHPLQLVRGSSYTTPKRPIKTLRPFQVLRKQRRRSSLNPGRRRLFSVVREEESADLDEESGSERPSNQGDKWVTVRRGPSLASSTQPSLSPRPVLAVQPPRRSIFRNRRQRVSQARRLTVEPEGAVKLMVTNPNDYFGEHRQSIVRTRRLHPEDAPPKLSSRRLLGPTPRGIMDTDRSVPLFIGCGDSSSRGRGVSTSSYVLSTDRRASFLWFSQTSDGLHQWLE